MKLLSSCLLFSFCVHSLIASSLIENGNFAADLNHWQSTVENASIAAHHTYNTWNTYSLTFNSKGYSSLYFYINVSPTPYTGGQVWFDNIRGEGLDIKNSSFEDCDVEGVPADWDYSYGMYNEMKRHAKHLIGTDFQYASDGVLSMRFFGPAQKNIWKLTPHPAPKRLTDGWKPVHAMSPWRPLAEGNMKLWQTIKVKTNTTYTIKMDYRFDKNFSGAIRPVIGKNFQPWGVLAHSGWQAGEFYAIQDISERFGKSFATMTIDDNGQASLSQDIPVTPGENYHVSLDMGTSRIYNDKKLNMKIGLICEDAETGEVISRDIYDWDGAPGFTEGGAIKDQAVQGADSVLQCHFVSPSNKIRIKISATSKGMAGKVRLGNVELTRTPLLIPSVQQAEWKSIKDNYHISDKITYTILQGDVKAIEGALWLTAKDLKEQNIEFTESKANANVTIAIGTFTQHGDEGYRLSVNRDGVRIESATPRGAQYALMTLLQLIGDDKDGKIFVAADIVDWPDMPVRGVVMEGCSHFVPRPENPVRLTDNLYHNMPRQTWCYADFLQLVRWKFNTVFWRSTGYSDRLDRECHRFHIDSMGFVSTISDFPNPSLLRKHPEWIEGIYVQDEKVMLVGEKVIQLANQHILRTSETDIVVQNQDKTITYTEGKDYSVVGKFGTIGSDRKFKDSKPFGIALIEGSRISQDATVYVSYDYLKEFGSATTYHRQYCLSNPDAVAAVGESVKKNAAMFNRKYLHIRGDELSFVNSDSRCKKRGMKACDLLNEHIKFLLSKAREGNPDVQVCMWNDSISPYTTGFKWGYTEDGPVPSKDIWQMVWHYAPGMPLDKGWADVKLCQKLGQSTIVFPWYNLRCIREWAQVVGEARRRGWNAMGIIDTPWGHPGPYVNFKETACVSWKVPAKGEKGWVEFEVNAKK